MSKFLKVAAGVAVAVVAVVVAAKCIPVDVEAIEEEIGELEE